MKCPEAIEWMHRDLDNDLNEADTTQLMEHIAHCEQCAESFRMLKSLAHELEELPLVVPKYSLVDAIMPQLDALDRAWKEKSASKELSTEEMVPMSPVSVPKRRFFTSTATRTMIGAVAAMGILGVAIYSYSPEQISDAQIQANTMAGSDMEATIAQKVVNNDGANHATASMESFDKKTLQQLPASEAEVSPKVDQTTPDPKQEKDVDLLPESPEISLPSQSSVGMKSSEPGSTKVADTPKQTKEDPQEPLSKDAPEQSNAQDNSRMIGPDKEQAADSKEIDVMDVNDINDVTPEVSSNSELPDEAIIDQVPSGDNVMAQIRSFGLVAPRSWDSPDGKMTAVLKAQKLVIYQLPLAIEVDKSIIQSIDLLGTWVSGEWSEDSKVFTYQTSLEGKVSSYTYPTDMAAVIAP